MPITASSERLQRIIQPMIAVRKVPEIRVDFSSSETRIRTLSEAHNVFIEYLLPPLGDPGGLYSAASGIHFDPQYVCEFLRVVGHSDVTIWFPSETDGSKMRLKSDGLTVHFAVAGVKMDNFDRSYSPSTVATMSLEKSDLNDSIQLANRIGNQLCLSVSPTAPQVRFFDGVQDSDDHFQYTIPHADASVQGDGQVQTRILLDRLKEVISEVPNGQNISITIGDSLLEIQTTYPNSSDKLSVIVAQIHSRL